MQNKKSVGSNNKAHRGLLSVFWCTMVVSFRVRMVCGSEDCFRWGRGCFGLSRTHTQTIVGVRFTFEIFNVRFVATKLCIGI